MNELDIETHNETRDPFLGQDNVMKEVGSWRTHLDST